jgi:hypothetical protein
MAIIKYLEKEVCELKEEILKCENCNFTASEETFDYRYNNSDPYICCPECGFRVLEFQSKNIGGGRNDESFMVGQGGNRKGVRG